MNLVIRVLFIKRGLSINKDSLFTLQDNIMEFYVNINDTYIVYKISKGYAIQ